MKWRCMWLLSMTTLPKGHRSCPCARTSATFCWTTQNTGGASKILEASLDTSPRTMLREINPPYLTGNNYCAFYNLIHKFTLYKDRVANVDQISCSIKKKVKKSGNTAARTLPNSPVVGRRSTQQVLTQPVDPGEALGWALVRYNYQAQQADELPLTKGSRVLVLEKSNDGWWRGQNASGQQVKSFANWQFNFQDLQLADDKNPHFKIIYKFKSGAFVSQPTLSPPLSFQLSGTMLGYVRCRMHIPRIFSAIFFEYIMKLNLAQFLTANIISLQGWFPSNYTQPDECSSSHSLERPSGDTDTLHTYAMAENVLDIMVALYSFSSQNDQELSFEKGDRLEILDRPRSDPEWYRARSAAGQVKRVKHSHLLT
jgi:hypothetical protein